MEKLILIPLVEELVEVLKKITPDLPEKYRELIYRVAAVAVGVVIALAFQIDYSGFVGWTPATPTVGYVFTGVVAGLLGSVFHRFLGIGSDLVETLKK